MILFWVNFVKITDPKTRTGLIRTRFNSWQGPMQVKVNSKLEGERKELEERWEISTLPRRENPTLWQALFQVM